MNAYEVGGSLFIPATHKNLFAVVHQKRYPHLRSVVVDFEDGLAWEMSAQGFKNLQKLLHVKQKGELPYLFVRPKNPTHLQKLLALKEIEAVDGFVLPKFSLANAHTYLNILKTSDFHLMPSIEGEELFDTQKLQKLRDILLTNKEKIVLVRFGLEDMLRQLSMRRSCESSVFDYAVCNVVLGNFLALFKSVGFCVSGGVYPCFDDTRGFVDDVQRDLHEGLFGKTLIHPKQIEILHELYKVYAKELAEAQEILRRNSEVFARDAKMIEGVTMQNHAHGIEQRARIYGIKSVE